MCKGHVPAKSLRKLNFLLSWFNGWLGSPRGCKHTRGWLLHLMQVVLG